MPESTPNDQTQTTPATTETSEQSPRALAALASFTRELIIAALIIFGAVAIYAWIQSQKAERATKAWSDMATLQFDEIFKTNQPLVENVDPFLEEHQGTNAAAYAYCLKIRELSGTLDSAVQEEALLTCDKFMQTYSHLPLADHVRLNRLAILLTLERYDEVAASVQPLLSRSAEVAIPARFYYGIALEHLGKTTEAINQFAAIAEDPMTETLWAGQLADFYRNTLEQKQVQTVPLPESLQKQLDTLRAEQKAATDAANEEDA